MRVQSSQATDDSVYPSVPAEMIDAEAHANRVFILVNDTTRDCNGAFVVPARAVTDDTVNLMVCRGRGTICLAITAMHALKLGLTLQPHRGNARLDLDFTVSIEARNGISTGISAADRAKTIQAAIDPIIGARQITSPGHIFPVVAAEGGVLERPGYTEASLDIMSSAGCPSVAAFCIILSEDGGPASLDYLSKLALELDLKIGRISDVAARRAILERPV